MKKLALVAALTLALPSLALADAIGDTNAKVKAKADEKKAADKPTKLADEDIKLVAHVHAVNLMEQDMGKLAAAKGSAAVKKYGAELQKDHMDGDKDLTAFAKAHGVAKIPADVAPTEAGKKDKADMDAKVASLKKMKAGAEFDKQFLDLMVMGHDTEIARLDTAIPMIKDNDLQSKMKDLRPVLQRHADTARELQKQTPTASNDMKDMKNDAMKTGATTPATARK
jgi:putative membrane protein